jgi:glc operon protein GlcG
MAGILSHPAGLIPWKAYSLMRQKTILSSVDAVKMVTAAKIEAAKNNWNVTIAVVDDGGYLMHLDRMDGAGYHTAEIATLKARTSAISRAPTKALEDAAKDRPGTLAFPNRLPVQGGLPIMFEGQCLGGIGVSGVKSHEDEQVGQAGLNALL